MTVPRDLGIQKVGDKFMVASKSVSELETIAQQPVTLKNIDAANFNLTDKIGKLSGPAMLQITSDKIENFSVTFSNSKGEKVIVGYDKSNNSYFIDRTNAGKVDFEKGFAVKHTAPRFSDKNNVDVTLVIDIASIELFADNGLSVMTEIFFPNEQLSDVTVQSGDNFKIKSLQFNKMKSIWK